MIDGQLYQSEGASATPITASIEDNILVIRFKNEDQYVSNSGLEIDHSNTIVNTDVVSGESTEPLRFQQSEVNAKSKLGNLPREITLPNDCLLVCAPSPLLNQWLDGGAGSRISQMETKKPWLVASVLLVPLLLYVIFVQGMPWAAVKFADQIPYSIKTLASQHTLSALDYSMLEPSTLPDLQREQLMLGFNAVVEQVSELGIESFIRVHFRDSELIGPNAFALPDGTIVFTDDLVTLVDGDQALLDAILFHEIGHVAQNHSMQMVAESLFATLAISYFFGDLSGAIESFMGIGSSVVQNQYSQKHEWQADNFAISHLKLMQRDPTDFAEVMRKLSNETDQQGADNSWFQSHPSTKARIENVEKRSL